MWKEFKEFAVKGNAVDLAVGVIIGAAFGGIVNSLVKDILMPVVGLLTGGLDFSNKFLILKGAPRGGSFNTPVDAAKAGGDGDARFFYRRTERVRAQRVDAEPSSSEREDRKGGPHCQSARSIGQPPPQLG